jgi:hypothetical protein
LIALSASNQNNHFCNFIIPPAGKPELLPTSGGGGDDGSDAGSDAGSDDGSVEVSDVESD